MSNPNPERGERVPKWDKSGLKEACQRALKLGRTHQNTDIQLTLDMLLEIERLESLYDSQAAEVIALRKEVAASERYQTLLLDQPDAATRMRDRCVEKVKSLAGSWAKSVEDQWDQRPDLSFDAAERLKAAGEIVTALQSLTLGQGEQEK